MSEREASMVVTSENLAEWTANRLGLAVEDAPTEAEESEPVVEAESQSEQEAESESEVADKPKQNPKLEKRFSELTKQREQARQEAADARAAKEALEIRLREYEEKTSPKQADPIGQEPQPNQFSDAFEYAKALAEYSTEKALYERDQQEVQRKAEQERAKVVESWSQKLEAAKSKLPDFDEMVQSADVAVSDVIRDSILESDVGPELLYYLAENTDFAKKLSEMPATKALRELGRLEAKFEKTEPVESKPAARKSNAPDPIKPLKATSAAADVKLDSNGQYHGTYAQWKADRRAGKIR